MCYTEVHTKEDFIAYTRWLYEDYLDDKEKSKYRPDPRDNYGSKENWDNDSLEFYLESFSAYIDSTLTSRDKDKELNWELISTMLFAGSLYE